VEQREAVAAAPERGCVAITTLRARSWRRESRPQACPGDPGIFMRCLRPTVRLDPRGFSPLRIIRSKRLSLYCGVP
jgi:hypothetical protein